MKVYHFLNSKFTDLSAAWQYKWSAAEHTHMHQLLQKLWCETPKTLLESNDRKLDSSCIWTVQSWSCHACQ